MEYVPHLSIDRGTGEILVDFDSNGKPRDWKQGKLKSIAVSNVMIVENRKERLAGCGSYLVFGLDSSGGKRLHQAYFCHDRMCPVCQKRRSMVVYSQVKQIASRMVKDTPSIRFLMLTLTVPNCEPDKLSETITGMFQGWQRLIQRKRVKTAVRGWFRSLEVTYNSKSNTYHPHFHILLAVPSNYFTKNYIKHADWLDLWRASMRDDSITQIDIRPITANQRKGMTDIESAAAEVGKYTTKPADYIELAGRDFYRANPDVVNHLAQCLANRRLAAFGGEMKALSKQLNLLDVESDKVDLIHTDDQNDIVEIVALVAYRWNSGIREYIS